MRQRAEDVVGRERELASFDVLDALPSGPMALVIEGEAGIGKTALWMAAAGGAEDRGYQVLACRPTQAEAKLPLAGIADLIEPIADEVLPSLPPVQRGALRTALLRGDDVAGPAGQRVLSAAVLTTLRLVAAVHPVVVAIDDVHWLDRPSARTLDFVVRRVGDEPIGVLLTRRSDAGAGDPFHVFAELGPERSRLLQVSGLAASSLGTVLQNRLDRHLSPAELAHVHRVSGGNPFFAIEIARALVSSPKPRGTRTPPPLPATVGDMAANRIRSLPPSAREPVLFASALARPTFSRLRSLLGEQAGDGIRAAVDAGVLSTDADSLSFTHPLLASAAYSDPPPERLRSVHRVIADESEELEERALHLALSSIGPDEEIASVLDEASRSALRRGASDASADLSTLARELTPHTDAISRHRRGIDAAHAYFSSGDIPRASQLLVEAVDALGPSPTRALAKVRLGAIRYYEQLSPQGPELFEEAMREVGDDPWMRSFIHQSLAYGYVLSGDLPKAASHADDALDIAERVGDPSLLSGALTQHAALQFFLGNGLQMEELRRAIELDTCDEFPTSYWRPTVVLPQQQKWTDDLDSARCGFDAELARMLERGEEHSVPLILCNLAEVEMLAGRYQRALGLTEEADQRAAQTGQESLHGIIMAVRAMLDALLGDVDGARVRAGEALTMGQRTGTVPIIWLNLTALGFLELSLGNTAAVHRHLGPLAMQGLGDPGLFRFMGDEIEALVELREWDLADSLLTQLEERGTALSRPWALGVAARGRALLEAARGDPEGSLALADRAVGHHATVGMPFELGRSLLVQGKLRRRSRQKRAARESLDAAQALFEGLPAPLWAAAAAKELRRISGRPPGRAALTPTEERVASLAAEGRTDREIAAALFISTRTASAHLTRIYRKLGVRSRTELAAGMRDGALVSEGHDGT